jgi:hypothetical protein
METYKYVLARFASQMYELFSMVRQIQNAYSTHCNLSSGLFRLLKSSLPGGLCDDGGV